MDYEELIEKEQIPMIMTALDVAKVLRISRNGAYEVMNSMGFPVIKIGKQYRVQREKFLRWLDEASSLHNGD